MTMIDFIPDNVEELAADLEVTVDYYLAEFVIPCDSD